MVGQGRSTPYLFSLPTIIVVAAVLAFPVLYGVWESLFRPEILGAPEEWVGFQNYAEMFQDEMFWSSLIRTFIFVGGCLIVGTTLGLLFAFALFQVIGRARFLRSISLGPYLISNVAAALMFRILFNSQFGLVNGLLGQIGIDGPSWLSQPVTAMLVVIFAQVWTDLPLDDPPPPRRVDDDRQVVPRCGARRWRHRLDPGEIRHHAPAHSPDRDQHRLAELLDTHRVGGGPGPDRGRAAQCHHDPRHGHVPDRVPVTSSSTRPWPSPPSSWFSMRCSPSPTFRYPGDTR